MAFIFEGLIVCDIILSFLYFPLIIYTYKKLVKLNENNGNNQYSNLLNTKKLFVMSLLLIVSMRFMSFFSMFLLEMNEQNFHFSFSNDIDKDDDNNFNDDDSSSSSKTKKFYDKSLLILFDFPDFYYLSAYFLLFVIWSETFLKSRRHWLSNKKFTRAFLLFYFVFNLVLYFIQIVLYFVILFIFNNINKFIQINIIYSTLSAFSFLLPIIWFLTYLYLTLIFSGFPYSTFINKARLSYLNKLGIVWTSTRMVWGILALTSVLNGWLTEVYKSKVFYTIVIILVFFVLEICPIIYSLQDIIISSLAEDSFLAIINNSGVASEIISERDSNKIANSRRSNHEVENDWADRTSFDLSSPILTNQFTPSDPIQIRQESDNNSNSYASAFKSNSYASSIASADTFYSTNENIPTTTTKKPWYQIF